jgi:hypothetical protein
MNRGQLDVEAGEYQRLDCGHFGATMALRTDGTIACWGDYCGGIPEGRFVQISARHLQACGLRENGVIECWGNDLGGVVSTAPVFGVFEQITVGWNFACGIRPGGSIECWGCEFTCEEEDLCGSYYYGQCAPELWSWD